MNEELCNKLSDAVYTKLTTEGLSNEDVTMDFPDITYSKSQSKRMSSIKLKITDVIADVYGAK